MHEVLEGSDQVMLMSDMEDVPFNQMRHFIYDAKWNNEEECDGIVETTWRCGVVGSHAFWVVEKLKWVRCGLQN